MAAKEQSSCRKSVSPRRILRALGMAFGCVLLFLLFSMIRDGITAATAARERYARDFVSEALRCAEELFQTETVLDRDRDGVGEFGDLSHLLAHEAEATDQCLRGKVREFRVDLAEGRIIDTYLVKVFVPASSVLSSRAWCGVAWPVRYGKGGVRKSFLFLHLGEGKNLVGWCESRRFSGWGRGPKLEDIFVGKPFESDLRCDIWNPGF
jgi:hypothetical protein